MRVYELNAKKVKKDIKPSSLRLGGENPAGDKISFSNYYMKLNGAPYFAICGEFHYSRYDCWFWEEEIIKMKMGGINTIASYVIWNFHEEEEGIFDWKGNKDLRHFVELCKKHGLYFILRIGPFAHGEARNGGLPDWLYGRPFNVRSNDEGYLKYVTRLYMEIGNLVKGLMYKDGGPIIGVQLENEFQAAGAPWETTPPQVTEWIGSQGGEEHMRILKNMALQAGMEAPIYTSTGWGGAPVLEDEVLPLYGGYAFWPWIFYGDVNEHPPTKEYLFQDFHNDNVKSEGFEPSYEKTCYPFACCEIGGGMQVWYNYRFTVPPVSVEAMPFMKAAGGCNFLGYYMYHGGSNPIGKHSYMNERTTPKISYDFQAPLGEFGQVRESYHRLKLLHYFFTGYAKEFCHTATVLPKGSDEIIPTDSISLRYAARVKENSGFLFINNYQDHVDMKDHEDARIRLSLDNEVITIPEQKGMLIKKDVCCILPFNMKIDEALLKYSTTQFICNLNYENVLYSFFFTPEGMDGEYCFDSNTVEKITAINGRVEYKDHHIFVHMNNSVGGTIEITVPGGSKMIIYTLTREQSLNFWKVYCFGRERILLTNANVLPEGERIQLRSIDKENLYLKIFPPVKEGVEVEGKLLERSESEDIFDNYAVKLEKKGIELKIEKINDAKAVIYFGEESFKDAKEVYLRIEYTGDVGYAYIDGKLVNDNFSNDATWEIGLKKFEKELLTKGMYVYISPIKEGGTVKRDSAMAAVKEVGGKETASIISIKAVAETSVYIQYWHH
jgi:hypothetical protein